MSSTAWPRIIFRVLHHPMDAEPHNSPSGEEEEEGFLMGISHTGRLFNGDQVRQGPAHHQEYCSGVYQGCGYAVT